jgi:hypothetical protein
MRSNAMMWVGGALLLAGLGACRGISEAHAGLEGDMARPSILDAGATRKPRQSPGPPETPSPVGPIAPTRSGL